AARLGAPLGADADRNLPPEAPVGAGTHREGPFLPERHPRARAVAVQSRVDPGEPGLLDEGPEGAADVAVPRELLHQLLGARVAVAVRRDVAADSVTEGDRAEQRLEHREHRRALRVERGDVPSG